MKRKGGSGASGSGRFERLQAGLFAGVSAESLALFRIAVGAIMLWEVYRFLAFGRVRQYWIAPEFNFTYTLFSWLRPLAGEAMVWLFYGLGVLALLIAVGLFHRAASLLFFLGFSYTFLLEESRYLNHLYLMCLLTFLLIFVPANRRWSLDARLWRLPIQAPAWSLWLIRFQVGVPYLYGGFAKINPDWLRGEPMRTWLAGKTSFPILGQLFTNEWTVALFSYGGLLIDLLAVPLLLWRRTRPWMYLTLIVFHLFNARLFNIGIFPWMMMIATTIFFEADWPSRLWRDLRARNGPVLIATLLGGGLIGALALWIGEAYSPVPLLAAIVSGAACGWSFVSSRLPIPADSAHVEAGAVSETAATLPQLPRRQLVLGLLTAWILVQGLLPLRHLLLPGRSSWTEEGHRFAWHMMLRTKSGSVVLRVTDPATGQVTTVDVVDVLPAWQYEEVVEAPHMLLQFAHRTAERFAAIGYPEVEVRAISSVSLNGRPRQLLVDPSVDLASLPRSLTPASYILPLETPLGDDDR